MNYNFHGRGVVYDLRNWTYFEGFFQEGKRIGQSIDYYANGDYEYSIYNLKEKKDGKALYFKSNQTSEPIVKVYNNGRKIKEYWW